MRQKHNLTSKFQKPEKTLQHEIILNKVLNNPKDLLQLENPDQPNQSQQLQKPEYLDKTGAFVGLHALHDILVGQRGQQVYPEPHLQVVDRYFSTAVEILAVLIVTSVEVYQDVQEVVGGDQGLEGSSLGGLNYFSVEGDLHWDIDNIVHDENETEQIKQHFQLITGINH
jgi:hypothetical protein